MKRGYKILLMVFCIIVAYGGYGCNQMNKSTYINKNISKAIINENNKKTISSNTFQMKKIFSEEDLKALKLIKKYYKEFNYSQEYIDIDEDIYKMIFKKQNKIGSDAYNSYEVFYYPYEKMVNYIFDGGTGNRGYGSYLIIDDKTVINIEKCSGESHYGYLIYKNGKEIDEEFKEIEDYKQKFDFKDINPKK